jgi:Probable lipoprotein LpqN
MPTTARHPTAYTAVGLLTLTACGKTTQGAPTPAAAEAGTPAPAAGNACASVDVPPLDVETHSDSEPRIRIPRPPGWERFTQMDSEIIRAAIVNKSLTAEGFTPNAVLALDVIPEKIDPQQAFEMGRESLKSLAGAAHIEVTDGYARDSERILDGLPVLPSTNGGHS